MISSRSGRGDFYCLLCHDIVNVSVSGFAGLVAALGVYMGYVGFRIMWVNSLAQTGLAVALALAAIGAVVLERLSKGSEKKSRLAQVLASVSLVAGMFNAFM